ncbi:MAG: cytidine deaminase [Bacteroidales bacterium]|nr:cytidine deaminase [Bacteroidales bacterium]
MQERKLEVIYHQCAFQDLNISDHLLMQRAIQAMSNAYAPYSQFRVGAAVLLDNQEIVIGSNQENSAYPSGLCAERVALFSAFAQFPDAKVKAIALTAQTDKFDLIKPISPCGACRQVMAEYENKSETAMRVIMMGSENHVILIDGIHNLLPFIFHENKLKNH